MMVPGANWLWQTRGIDFQEDSRILVGTTEPGKHRARQQAWSSNPGLFRGPTIPKVGTAHVDNPRWSMTSLDHHWPSRVFGYALHITRSLSRCPLSYLDSIFAFACRFVLFCPYLRICNAVIGINLAISLTLLILSLLAVYSSTFAFSRLFGCSRNVSTSLW